MHETAGDSCREVIPFLVRHLKARDPFDRQMALRDLADLKCRECRGLFVEVLLNDRNAKVRDTALLTLHEVFVGERDLEILALALRVFDAPRASLAARLTAGAVMMYQLDLARDPTAGPAWWDTERKDLRHPYIVEAVAETRRLLLDAGWPNVHARTEPQQEVDAVDAEGEA